MGICKTSEYRAWQKNCQGNHFLCIRKEGRCDCFRISGNERKTFREEKAKVEFKEAKEYLDKLIPLLSADKPAQKKMMDNAKTMLNWSTSSPPP